MTWETNRIIFICDGVGFGREFAVYYDFF